MYQYNNGEPYPNTDFYLSICDIFVETPEKFLRDILNTRLHHSTFKTPPSGAVISGEGDADCAFQMRNCVKCPVVFLRTELLFYCMDILSNIQNDYILITICNDDICVPYITMPPKYPVINNQIGKVLMNPHLKAWFTKNLCIIHPKIHPIPIGPKFQYNTTQFFGEPKEPIVKILDKYCLTPSVSFRRKKPNLLYFNFSIGTTDEPFVNSHTGIRSKINSQLLEAGYSPNPPKQFEDYLKDLGEHRFCVSPPGRGIDTHRCWESLMVGTIPIMINSSLDSLFEHLPVVLVPEEFDWKTLTVEWLGQQYNQLLERDDYDFSILYSNYWREKIRNSF